MSCNCGSSDRQGTQYCQECLPSIFEWLVPVKGVPDPFLMDRNHAYVTDEGYVYVLDYDRTSPLELSGIDTLKEVIQARGGHPSLDARLDGLDAKDLSLQVRIDDLENETPVQVPQTERREKAYDLVDYLSKSSSLSPLMSVKMGNPNYKYFWVNIPTSDEKGVQYQFGKDKNDDFQILLNGDFGDLIKTESITESKNNDSEFLSGVFEKGYAPNYWMSTIGNYIATDFYGTKVTFNHFANNVGGIFEAILNEGTGDERRKTISVFSETPIPVKEQILFENLNPQKHTIKLVFKGQDPANPVASPKGWWYFGGTKTQYTKRTFNIYNDVTTVEPTSKIMYGYTVKEFAISARPFGSTEPFIYIPEHSNPTAFKIDEPILLLNGSVPIWNEGNIYKDIHTVQIIQNLKGIHPSDPSNPLMEIDIIQTVKNGEYNISGKIKFLRKTEIDTGYALMLGYDNTTAKKIKTGLGNEYTVKTDGSKETIPSSDNSYSIVVFNDVDSGEKANIALAMTVDNVNRTQRIGELNTGGQWIEHRNASMGKTYFQQFKNAVMEVGDVYRFSGKYIITEIPKVSRFLL